MRYFNLVYAKHYKSDRRAYLYSLPLEKEVDTGNRLYVRDRQGDHIVTATSPNFFCSEMMTKRFCENNGGYFPPAEVVGTVDTITVRQDIVNTFDGQTVPTDMEEKEDIPWL